MQALLGVITQNFRMVWVSIEDVISVHVILEKESEDDMEEIEDLKSEFESLQLRSVDYKFDVSVSNGELAWPDRSSSIVVYKRREN
jgi:hypothetical protein